MERCPRPEAKRGDGDRGRKKNGQKGGNATSWIGKERRVRVYVRVVEIDGGVGERTCRITVQMWLGSRVIWDTTCQINDNRIRPPMGKIRGCRREKIPDVGLDQASVFRDLNEFKQ